MRSFRSDNNAGLCPEALQAIVEANDGSHQIGYGDDAFTARAVDGFKAIFGQDIAVFFVATGTAANTLAIASLTEPWQQVICHAESHYADDESTAPERLTHCRTVAVRARSSKITVEELDRATAASRGDVHQPQPGVVTVSNTTEYGTIYRPDELRELCTLAHERGYRVHVDGARFANAVASLDCDPRELTSLSGVDAVSFGGTKNGLACGEAVIFFPQGDRSAFERTRSTFEFHRKGTGHLLSKHRFLAAPFAAVLREGIWLKHASRANAMARRLADGLDRLGFGPVHPVEANAVFVRLDDDVHASLVKSGHGYYPFGRGGQRTYRLMCSFDTREDDVDRFLADVASARRPR